MVAQATHKCIVILCVNGAKNLIRFQPRMRFLVVASE